MDDARLAPGRVLGRLPVRLGRPGRRPRGVDRLTGPRSGADTREGANGKGFSVFQDDCVYDPNDINAAVYTTPTIDDPCLDEGGLDQNIYGARV